MKHTVPSYCLGQGKQFATLIVAAVFSFSAQAKELKFDEAFSTKGEPASLHFLADYQSNGTDHHLEVWRQGEQRLKRVTDNNIEVYVNRKHGDNEFQMSVLDLKKRIHTRIDKSSLNRIGNFTDWFDLSHGLKHPLVKNTVTKVAGPKDAPQAIMDCQWYDLTAEGHTSHICWNRDNHLPLLIQNQDGKVVWRITNMDKKPVTNFIFEIHDENFILNNANQDIQGD